MPLEIVLRGSTRFVTHPSVTKAVERFRTLVQDESLLRQIAPICRCASESRKATCDPEEVERLAGALNTTIHIHFEPPLTWNQRVPKSARIKKKDLGTYGWYYGWAVAPEMDTTLWVNSNYLYDYIPDPDVEENIAHILLVTMLHELCHFLVKRLGGDSPVNPWPVGPILESGEYFEVITFGGRLGYCRGVDEPKYKISSLYLTSHSDKTDYMVPAAVLDHLWTADAPVFPVPSIILACISTKLADDPSQVKQRPSFCLGCDRSEQDVEEPGEDIVYVPRPFGDKRG